MEVDRFSQFGLKLPVGTLRESKHIWPYFIMKLNWNFPRGRGILEKLPSMGEGMDMFWNETLIGFKYIFIYKYLGLH